jgi:hypothetical protein
MNDITPKLSKLPLADIKGDEGGDAFCIRMMYSGKNRMKSARSPVQFSNVDPDAFQVAFE